MVLQMGVWLWLGVFDGRILQEIRMYFVLLSALFCHSFGCSSDLCLDGKWISVLGAPSPYLNST